MVTRLHPIMSTRLLIIILIGVLATRASSVITILQSPALASSQITEPAGLVIVPMPEDEAVSQTEVVRYIGELDRDRTGSVDQRFLIVNRGMEAVRIDKLQTTCACSSLGLFAGDMRSSSTDPASLGPGAPAMTLAPGQSATLRAVLDLHRIASGPARKYIWAFLPGKSKPAVMMRLDLWVLAPVVASTRRVGFGRLRAGRAKTVPFSYFVDSQRYASGAVPTVFVSNPDVTATAVGKPTARVRDGRAMIEYRLSLTFVSHTLGRILGALTLDPKMADPNRVIATLNGEVLGEGRADPGTVHFGVAKQGRASISRIELKMTSVSAARGLRITTSIPWVRARLARSKSEAALVRSLEVSLLGDAPAGVVKETVTVTFPSGQRIKIPILAVVESAGQR